MAVTLGSGLLPGPTSTAAAGVASVQRLHRAPYGATRGGEAVERVVLRNATGMTVGILTLGGIIDEIQAPDIRGRRSNVVLALPNLAAYEARPNFGSIVGRFANRISHGGFTLDGRRYALSADPAATVSHGGKTGFATRVWKIGASASPSRSSVTLRLVSADGDNLFPGTLSVAVTYSLSDDDTLRIDYTATTDRPTVVNLTNHSYFNLAGAVSGSADAQLIQIVASRYTPIDRRSLPTGAILPVDGSPLDLRVPVRIGDRIAVNDPQIAFARGFDHNFVLDKPPGEAMPVAARALDPVSGRTLEVRTTEPGLQFYTANGFDGSLAGAGGRLIRQGAGYALETQHFPDSPNRPEFPSTVLRPGETYRSATSFHFGTVRRSTSARDRRR